MTGMTRTAILAAALLAAGCAVPQPPPPQALGEEAARVRFLEFSSAGAAIDRRVFHGPLEREEYALFRSPDGARAEVIYVEAREAADITLARPFGMRTLDGPLAGWRFNRGAVADIGPVREADLHFGRLYRRYRHAETGRECVGFAGERDIPSDDDLRRPSEWLIGYYCAPPGETLTAARAGDIVDAVRIVGDPPPWWLDLPMGRAAAALPADAGHNDYPFEYARHFSPDDDNGDDDA